MAELFKLIGRDSAEIGV